MFSFDTLSIIFLLLIFLGVIPNLFYSFGYMDAVKAKIHYHIHYFAFILSMIGVVLSNNFLLFLFFWELMSLTSWQLILNNPKEKSTKDAAKFYFFMTHFGFVFILLFFLIVSNGHLTLTFKESACMAHNFAYPTLLFFLIIFGFLSKAGVVPFHVWLPYAHPEAPSAVSALMSGIMLKIAIYAFFRFLFDVLYPWPLEWGIVVLILGSLSSLVGVLYALSEHDIKALLANHSIENIGIILIGFGMGMIFDTLHLYTLSAFAFIASLFHTFNHMSFKSLLFMGAGSILHQTHTKNMEKYGSLIKNMPVTAFTFLLASISISALPPTNGFLSEWMIFQSMLSSSSITQISLKISIPFAVFALALTGGLAIACFVKAYGITFLGLGRSENAKHAKESNFLMKTGMVLMSLVIISLMLVTPVYIKLFDRESSVLHNVFIYDKIFKDGIFSMHSVANNGGVVTPVVLLVVLLAISFILFVFYKSLKLPLRKENSWACGYQTNHRTQYSATGFAGPIRRFFSWLYKPEEHNEKVIFHGHESKFKMALYEVHVKPLFEKSLYAGAKRVVNYISYFVYKVAHFEQSRYAAIIFNLMLSALFGYRIVAGAFSWANLILEAILLTISIKILLIGDKK